MSRIDESIAQARKWGSWVNSDALVAMHYVRVCSLHRLGRDKEAGLSIAFAMGDSPTANASLHLCLGDRAAARTTLLAALEFDDWRQAVVAFAQRTEDRPVDSELGREIFRENELLRADPELLKALAKYGRVLPHSIRDGAPPE